MFFKKKKSRLELLREAALHRAHDAFESAQEVLQHASGAVQGTLEHAPETIEGLKAGAAGTISSAVASLGSRAGDAAHVARKGAHEKFSHAGDLAHDRVEGARHLLDDKRQLLEKKLVKKQRKAAKAHEAVQNAAREKVKQVRAPELTTSDGYEKWLWLGVGVLLGAAIGVLLAPSSGRRNRALLRDKLVHGAHKAEDLGEAATRKARDLGNRAEGVAHKISETVTSKIGGDSDDADDVTIADRVRTELGRLPEASSLERINVDSFDGVVTLRGPIVDASTRDALLAATRKISGVRDVVSDLLLEDESEPNFVG